MPPLGRRLKYSPDSRVIAIYGGRTPRFPVRLNRKAQKLDGISDMGRCDLAEGQVPYLVFPPVNVAFPHPPGLELGKLLFAVAFYRLRDGMV